MKKGSFLFIFLLVMNPIHLFATDSCEIIESNFGEIYVEKDGQIITQDLSEDISYSNYYELTKLFKAKTCSFVARICSLAINDDDDSLYLFLGDTLFSTSYIMDNYLYFDMEKLLDIGVCEVLAVTCKVKPTSDGYAVFRDSVQITMLRYTRYWANFDREAYQDLGYCH